MGRINVKEAPAEVQEILDYMNEVIPEELWKDPDLDERAPDEISVLNIAYREIERNNFAWLCAKAHDPDQKDQYIVKADWLLRFVDGYISLTYIAASETWDKILHLHRDTLQRIFKCPGCHRFNWRKKIDSQTCSRKCADKYNNVKRRKKRKEEQTYGDL